MEPGGRIRETATGLRLMPPPSRSTANAGSVALTAASWLCPRTLLNGRIYLGRTLPDLVNLQRAGLLARHSGRAHGHPWQRDAGDLRFLREQTVYNLDRDMAANDIASDQRNVTGL